MPTDVTRAAQPAVISGWTRALLTGCGGVAWAAGGVATFVSGNGSGTVALTTTGLVAVVLGLIGRWPQRISISGNEVGWDEVRRAVESSIEEAERDIETGIPGQVRVVSWRDLRDDTALADAARALLTQRSHSGTGHWRRRAR